MDPNPAHPCGLPVAMVPSAATEYMLPHHAAEPPSALIRTAGVVRRPAAPAAPGAGGVSDEERHARAALTRVVEPGDESVGRWLGRDGARALLEAVRGDGPAPAGVSEARLAGLRLRRERCRPEEDLRAIDALGGRFVCPGDEEWPGQLDDLQDARPIGLWVRGVPNLRMWALRSVAVVGARACTPYGAHQAGALGAGLAERGWVVVSGGAYGIDGAAHRAALAVEGATAAVVASGVDQHYPRGHNELLRRIAGQGLIVGELPPGEHPTRSRFVLRNRVIAALTRGTVVVEAELRSGSLVTARRASSLGRFTMGVPGPVSSSLSAGVHQLLRGEGVLVTDADEVIELVGSIGELAPERRGPLLARDLLDPVAARVLEALPARGVAALDRLVRESGTDRELVKAKLCELQALGFAQREGSEWKLVAGAASRTCSRRGGA